MKYLIAMLALCVSAQVFGEELSVTVGDDVAFTIQATAPTENVDDSPLTDLQELRLYSCGGADCVPTDFRDAYPAAAGDQVTMPRSFTPDQVAGDVVVVRYAATAVDADGDESVLSNVKEYVITFVEPVTIPKPPALMMN